MLRTDINFEVYDWKQTDAALKQVIKLSQSKQRVHFMLLEDGSDDYIIAYSTVPFTRKAAVNAFNSRV